MQLIGMLQELGTNQADIRVIPNLCWGQTAAVGIGRIERRVRQGCVVSSSPLTIRPGGNGRVGGFSRNEGGKKKYQQHPIRR